MTGEEKINKDIASRSREEKMQEIMETICDWDISTLVEVAQENISERIENLSNSDFDSEYYEWFSNRYEDGEWEDDEMVEAIFEEKEEVLCSAGCGKMKDADSKCWWCGN